MSFLSYIRCVNHFPHSKKPEWTVTWGNTMYVYNISLLIFFIKKEQTEKWFKKRLIFISFPRDTQTRNGVTVFRSITFNFAGDGRCWLTEGYLDSFLDQNAWKLLCSIERILIHFLGTFTSLSIHHSLDISLRQKREKEIYLLLLLIFLGFQFEVTMQKRTVFRSHVSVFLTPSNLIQGGGRRTRVNACKTLGRKFFVSCSVSLHRFCSFPRERLALLSDVKNGKKCQPTVHRCLVQDNWSEPPHCSTERLHNLRSHRR